MGNINGELPACEEFAISHFFDGDRILFMSFRQGCVQQFDLDLDSGDRAIVTDDIQGLRRVAHSLKGVLRTIGYEDLSEIAKGVENAAHLKQWETAVSQWHEFSKRLRQAFNLKPSNAGYPAPRHQP